MSEMLVMEGEEYNWLLDFLTRMEDNHPMPTGEDLHRISGLMERTSCCQRCEDTWNARALENAGYEKKGGVYVQA